MLRLVHCTRRIPIDTLRIAMTIAPDGTIRERVVARNASVVIHAQYLPCKRIEILRQIAFSRISRRDVELPVRPEGEFRARVELRCGDSCHDACGVGEGIAIILERS